VDEGVKELRALLATAPKATRTNARSGSRQYLERSDHALTLARLGHLLEKPEWTAEGLAAAMPRPDANADSGDDYAESYRRSGLVEVLVEVGRLAEAEELLADQLAKAIKQTSNQRGYADMLMTAGRSPATEPAQVAGDALSSCRTTRGRVGAAGAVSSLGREGPRTTAFARNGFRFRELQRRALFAGAEGKPAG
jgi:hypothetical protein